MNGRMRRMMKDTYCFQVWGRYEGLRGNIPADLPTIRASCLYRSSTESLILPLSILPSVTLRGVVGLVVAGTTLRFNCLIRMLDLRRDRWAALLSLPRCLYRKCLRTLFPAGGYLLVTTLSEDKLPSWKKRKRKKSRPLLLPLPFL